MEEKMDIKQGRPTASWSDRDTLYLLVLIDPDLDGLGPAGEVGILHSVAKHTPGPELE